LRTLNGGTYELVSDVLVNAQENFDKNSEFSTKIEELNENIATLTAERDNANEQIGEYTTQLETATSTINSLTEENNSLKQYKLDIETQQKTAVIEEYSEHLDEGILDTYRNALADYTVEELDMHLAYELKKTNSSIFTRNNSDEGFVPKDVPAEGINAILSKYKK
jgi:chromosome segregation ATPase